jgi:hypothetical protein
MPQPGNPQSLNRYAYVLNSPLRYTDPTGMYVCEDAYGDCDPATAWAIETIIQVEISYGVSVTGDWSGAEARMVQTAFQRMERGIAHQLGVPAEQARSILATTFAGGTITRGSNTDPMHAYGVLVLFLLTGSPGAPMGSTFAPYYTIGASGSLTFPGLAGPTVFAWDKGFAFGTKKAIETIIHESGHLLDYLVSPGTPDVVTGSAASRSFFRKVGYQYAPSGYAKESPPELLAETWVAYIGDALDVTKHGRHIQFFSHLLAPKRGGVQP